MRASPGRLIIAAACCAALAAIPASVAQATSGGRAHRTTTAAATTTATGGSLSTVVPSAGAPPAKAPPTATPAPPAPPVRIVVTPEHPTVGAAVHLSVSAPPADAHAFAWDLAGQGAFTRHTTAPTTVAQFTTPGAHTVAVRFDEQGHTALGVATVTVAARAQPAQSRHSEGQAHAQAREHTHARRTSQGLDGQVTAHAAGDPGVTVADFHFSPSTTTIHVGDTVTWSNDGPSSHTATATNGSFNTGILKKGQSASHTFTQPGTYSYICQIHTFMHGTIVVLASTTSAATTPTTTTPAGTTPTSTTPAATTAAADTGPTLPNTGFNVLGGLLAGLALVALGVGLRRARTRSQH